VAGLAGTKLRTDVAISLTGAIKATSKTTLPFRATACEGWKTIKDHAGLTLDGVRVEFTKLVGPDVTGSIQFIVVEDQDDANDAVTNSKNVSGDKERKFWLLKDLPSKVLMVVPEDWGTTASNWVEDPTDATKNVGPSLCLLFTPLRIPTDIVKDAILIEPTVTWLLSYPK